MKVIDNIINFLLYSLVKQIIHMIKFNFTNHQNSVQLSRSVNLLRSRNYRLQLTNLQESIGLLLSFSHLICFLSFY